MAEARRDIPAQTALAIKKAALRKAAGQRRKAAHDAAETKDVAKNGAKGEAKDESGAALAMRDHFLAAGLDRGCHVVAGYWPIRSEIDPKPLMRALIGRGCRLCLPVIMGEGLALTFREWTPDTPMQPGPYGAAVPRDGAMLQPDLLLVPLLAFDAGGRRLGYGGGFYDRTLGKLRAARAPGAAPLRAIGLAHAAQQVDRVPAEETDQPLDAVVTDRGAMCMREGIS